MSHVFSEAEDPFPRYNNPSGAQSGHATFRLPAESGAALGDALATIHDRQLRLGRSKRFLKRRQGFFTYMMFDSFSVGLGNGIGNSQGS